MLSLNLKLQNHLFLSAILLLPLFTFPAPTLFADNVAHASPLPRTDKATNQAKPNIIVIFADDLGYGDLACFGHPSIRTPHLDRMAAEGQKWTSFYSAACVCTPSRAALQTGRYPIRNGMCSNTRRVLFPDSTGGLPKSEITIAKMLKNQGYKTHAIGKWHLGHLPQYLPTAHGYDSYFGIPYSNDMDPQRTSPKGRAKFWNPKIEFWNVPLMRDEEVVERPANQHTITKRYTEEAIQKIKAAGGDPFFIYLAHNLPHVPLFVSQKFNGKSRAGLYGDVIEEIDWSVGQIMETLRSEKLAKNTLVVFTSDNGPWLVFKTHGGSAGLLRDGKGSTWEGGMREPTIFWWPGTAPPKSVRDMGSTLDLLPTFASLTGAPIPQDRSLDGYDLSSVIKGTSQQSPRNDMFFYHGEEVYAVRQGKFKAHFKTKTSYVGQRNPVIHDPPLLYHLEHDPSEKHNIAAQHPDVVAQLTKLKQSHEASIEPVESRLLKRITAKQ